MHEDPIEDKVPAPCRPMRRLLVNILFWASLLATVALVVYASALLLMPGL
ncbi:MAG: hypothetical protein OHK0039_39270 [Bacteroidia bacterium]